VQEINLIEQRLPEIYSMGYVPTLRKGNTGVGYTLEELFDIDENNDSGADINGIIELKAQRKGGSSRTTGFCQNFLWNNRIRDIIKKYGWLDGEKPHRINFYPSLRVDKDSPNGLKLQIVGQDLNIVSEKKILATIPLAIVEFRFRQKLNKLLLVYAESKKINKVEHFHYNEAYLCQYPKVNKIIELLIDGKLVVEPRCYLDTLTGKIRDRGVAWRLKGEYLKELYGNVKKIV